MKDMKISKTIFILNFKTSVMRTRYQGHLFYFEQKEEKTPFLFN